MRPLLMSILFLGFFVFLASECEPVSAQNQFAWSVAFSPDSETLASATRDQTIKLWDVTTDKLIATLKGHENETSSLAFSPDSNILASGSIDTTVKLWDVTTRKLKTTLKGHTRETYFVAFSSDGKTLASATRNEIIKLWDVTMDKLRTTLHSSKVDWE